MATYAEIDSIIEDLLSRTGAGSINQPDLFGLIQDIKDKLQSVDSTSSAMSLRKSYTTYALMTADVVAPVDAETGNTLKYGQLVVVTDDSDTTLNGIYRYLTTSWELVAAIADLTDYAKNGGSEKTLAEVDVDVQDLVSKISTVSNRKWLFALSYTGQIFAGIKTNGQFYFNSDTISDLKSRVTSLEGISSTNLSNISSLNTLRTALTSRVTVNEGYISENITSISNLQSKISYISDRKWMFAIAFKENIFVGIKNDGQLYFNAEVISEIKASIISINSLIDALSLRISANENNIISINDKISYVSDRKWLFALSYEGQIFAGIKNDGQLYFNSSALTEVQELISSLDAESLSNISIISDRKWLFAISYNNQVFVGIKIDGQLYFNSELSATVTSLSSELSSLTSRVTSLESAKLVVDWGDSLTAGAGGAKVRNKSTVIAALATMGYDLSSLSSTSVTYTKVLQVLLGSDYNCINCGVGGETINSIGARLGAWMPTSQEGFVLPADGSVVEIGNSTIGLLKSTYDDKITQLLAQGEGNSVNPCSVEGIECTLSADVTDYVVSNYYIKRNSIGTRDVTIPLGTPIICYGAKAYRDTGIAILWCFQNGGYDDVSDLITKLKLITENLGTKKFIIVGLHTGTTASRAEIESALLKSFGDKFFNWGSYASSNALYDFGITPTTDADFTQDQLDNGVLSDEYQMSVGGLPSSLWQKVYGIIDDYDGLTPTSNDSTHMGGAGYMILGYKLYERAKNLGYID